MEGTTLVLSSWDQDWHEADRYLSYKKEFFEVTKVLSHKEASIVPSYWHVQSRDCDLRSAVEGLGANVYFQSGSKSMCDLSN